MEPTLRAIHDNKELEIPDVGKLPFDPDVDIAFDYAEELPRHTNGMRFCAHDADGKTLITEDWYSIGGGFVVRGDEEEPMAQQGEPPYPFSSAEELLRRADEAGLCIAELMRANERHWRSDRRTIRERIDALWDAMRACVRRGLQTEGVLPGEMSVVQRAPKLYKSLQNRPDDDPPDIMDWVNAYAIAVNEENAAGGR
ncbi:MAG: serine dehydratase beta chain [Woeseiaceae bacterium]|nr:serine dehydratase beta chain [Woeseiaceae bacterium]